MEPGWTFLVRRKKTHRSIVPANRYVPVNPFPTTQGYFRLPAQLHPRPILSSKRVGRIQVLGLRMLHEWIDQMVPCHYPTTHYRQRGRSQTQPQGCDKQSGEYHADRFPIASSGAAEAHQSLEGWFDIRRLSLKHSMT